MLLRDRTIQSKRRANPTIVEIPLFKGCAKDQRAVYSAPFREIDSSESVKQAAFVFGSWSQ